MNIIIPLGGKGERFSAHGYKEPKPLINILGKPMIFHVLDNLCFMDEESVTDSTALRGTSHSATSRPVDHVFIIYYNVDGPLFENIIKEKYPRVHFIELNEQTKGAAETIFKGIPHILSISPNKKTMILDCDTFYTQDVISMYRNINTDHNAVFYVNNTNKNPIFSYIDFDLESVPQGKDSDKTSMPGSVPSGSLHTNHICKIAEKIKISDNANTGIYCFADIHTLYTFSESVVLNNITFKNECYTSCIIDQMIKNAHIFVGIQLDSQFVFNLGTPSQLDEYIAKTHLFLFDLDGTLVNSEKIYFEVWKQILLEYNIHLTSEIFEQYISGNNDMCVLQNLLPNMVESFTGVTDARIDIGSISRLKDDLFIQNIDNIQIVEGAYDFLATIRKAGHRIVLVTNCNRYVSEAILNHLHISHFFEFIVIGNECKHPKPYPDPYQEAIRKLNGSNKKAIIFEDSKSGLLSAAGVSPKCIVGIETIYSSEELINYSANITIKNYIDFDMEQVIEYENMGETKLKHMIRQSLNMDIHDIQISSTKLKGGFISDVIQLTITLRDNSILDCILKLENKNETFLTKMSNDLDLYNREYYFYEAISKYVPIQIPLFYCLVKDDQFNNVGILMKNIGTDEYILNLNLNNESINTSMKIIDRLATMHSKFWNKPINLHFRELKKHDNPMFNPKWSDFVHSRWDLFKQKWSHVLSKPQIDIGEYIVEHFSDIQAKLSDTNLTLCHGDVKSANIFYKILGNEVIDSKSTDPLRELKGPSYEPYFIDWQYIAMGKGVQDLVFFMIESFDIGKMKIYKTLFKEYYYVKLVESGIQYDRVAYEADFLNASYYFPFFVAVWFGTISEDELIDKNFPLFFIQKLFHFYTI